MAVSRAKINKSLRKFGHRDFNFQREEEVVTFALLTFSPREEDDLHHSEDRAPRTENGNDPIVVWEARLEMLEARVAKIEARVEGLKRRLHWLQRVLRIVCVLFLITLAYALCRRILRWLTLIFLQWK